MSALFQELFQTSIYKRSQGRITRQVTFAAIAIGLALGLWRLSQTLAAVAPIWRLGIPLVTLVVGLWITYRLVNLPAFADFLIAVEAEMNKVSWPTRHELYRASLVVLLVIFLLTVVLLVFDTVWKLFFHWLRII